MPLAKLEDINIYYEVKDAKSGIPLVMVPGLGGDIMSFASAAGKLRKHIPVVLVENRGVGRSSVTEAPYSTSQMAEDLLLLLDYLGYSKVNLLGHSMGGYIVQKLAARKPDKLNKLILSGTAACMSDANKTAFSKLYDDRASGKITSREFYSTMLKICIAPSFYNDDVFMEAALAFMMNYPYQQSLPGLKGQLTACFNHNSLRDLKKIKNKTLVVTGELDEIGTVKDSEFLHESIAKSELCVIDGMAHLPCMEKPDLYVKCILDFLSG